MDVAEEREEAEPYATVLVRRNAVRLPPRSPRSDTHRPAREEAMTLDELREELAATADELRRRAYLAEADHFAPWVVLCLRRAAFLATLSDQALRECKNSVEFAEASR